MFSVQALAESATIPHLRSLLRNSGYTQGEVAEMVGVRAPTISSWCSGDKSVPMAIEWAGLAAFMEALAGGYDVEAFVKALPERLQTLDVPRDVLVSIIEHEVFPDGLADAGALSDVTINELRQDAGFSKVAFCRQCNLPQPSRSELFRIHDPRFKGSVDSLINAYALLADSEEGDAAEALHPEQFVASLPGQVDLFEWKAPLLTYLLKNHA